MGKERQEFEGYSFKRKEEEPKSRVTTVIMAGGRGERLKPITDHTPKPLVLWNGKPLIDYSIKAAKEVSSSILVTTSAAVHEAINEYLTTNWPDVLCVCEPTPLKTGGSLKFFAKEIFRLSTDNLLFLTADHVRKADFKDAIKTHKEKQNDITIIVSEYNPKHTAVVAQADRIVDYLPSNQLPGEGIYANTGEYIFKWPVLAKFLQEQRDEVFDIGWGVVARLVQSPNCKVGYYYIEEWVDLGTLDNYLSLELRKKFK